MAEKEYIEKVAFNYAIRDAVKKYPNSFYNGLEVARQIAHDFPAADVRPVVRGRWIGYPECLKFTNAYSDDHIVCSDCEECFSILDNDCERFNFCPNCGADMREA
jgi:hypothetical protein